MVELFRGTVGNDIAHNASENQKNCRNLIVNSDHNGSHSDYCIKSSPDSEQDIFHSLEVSCKLPLASSTGSTPVVSVAAASSGSSHSDTNCCITCLDILPCDESLSHVLQLSKVEGDSHSVSFMSDPCSSVKGCASGGAGDCDISGVMDKAEGVETAEGCSSTMAYRKLSCELENIRSLQPFGHQVGGHASMLKIGENKICKPLSAKERDFYECVRKHMKPLMTFIPCYLGSIDVVVKKSTIPSANNNEGGNAAHEIPVAFVKLHDERKCELAYQKKIKGLENSVEKNLGSEMGDGLGAANDGSDAGVEEVSPWGMRCFEQYKKKLEECGTESEPYEYILIEDLTSQFKRPCVLDLKMGVRHYADGASEDKIRSQSAKSASTTSSSLGVRICGMQVFNVQSGNFEYQDKYIGRKLTPATFKTGLLQFLNNGAQKRYDLIPAVLSKLEKLRSCMEVADGYRFFSSSLLVIYEGDEKNGSGERGSKDLVDLRMIDFANTALPSKHCHSKGQASGSGNPDNAGGPEYSGPDAGYLFGLNSLIRIFTDILESTSL